MSMALRARRMDLQRAEAATWRGSALYAARSARLSNSAIKTASYAFSALQLCFSSIARICRDLPPQSAQSGEKFLLLPLCIGGEFPKYNMFDHNASSRLIQIQTVPISYKKACRAPWKAAYSFSMPAAPRQAPWRKAPASRAMR